MFICHLYVLLVKCLCSFSNWIACFCFYFTVELWTFFMYCSNILAIQYSTRSLLLDIWFANIFLFLTFFFFKILIGFHRRKFLTLDEVQFIRFLFMGLVFVVKSENAKSENCRPSSALWRFSVVLHLSLWSVWISFYVSYEI